MQDVISGIKGYVPGGKQIFQTRTNALQTCAEKGDVDQLFYELIRSNYQLEKNKLGGSGLAKIIRGVWLEKLIEDEGLTSQGLKEKLKAANKEIAFERLCYKVKIILLAALQAQCPSPNAELNAKHRDMVKFRDDVVDRLELKSGDSLNSYKNLFKDGAPLEWTLLTEIEKIQEGTASLDDKLKKVANTLVGFGYRSNAANSGLSKFREFGKGLFTSDSSTGTASTIIQDDHKAKFALSEMRRFTRGYKGGFFSSRQGKHDEIGKYVENLGKELDQEKEINQDNVKDYVKGIYSLYENVSDEDAQRSVLRKCFAFIAGHGWSGSRTQIVFGLIVKVIETESEHNQNLKTVFEDQGFSSLKSTVDQRLAALTKSVSKEKFEDISDKISGSEGLSFESPIQLKL